MPLDNLRAADLEIPDLGLHAGDQQPVQPAAQPLHAPDQQRKNQRRDRREPQRLEHRTQVPGLAGFGNDLLQLPRRLGGHRLRILLLQGVGVGRGDHEGESVIDHHQLPLGVALHGHDERAPLVQGLIDGEARPVGPRLGRCAEKTGPEHDHRPVEDGQRDFVARRLAPCRFRSRCRLGPGRRCEQQDQYKCRQGTHNKSHFNAPVLEAQNIVRRRRLARHVPPRPPSAEAEKPSFQESSMSKPCASTLRKARVNRARAALKRALGCAAMVSHMGSTQGWM